MKKIIALFLSLIIVAPLVLSLVSCSDERVHIYTRGEWIDQVASVFGLSDSYSDEPYYEDVGPDNMYFTAIQACAEWEIIEKNGKFEPNKRADVNFAMVTAVKAVGIDRIAKSVEGRELDSERDIIEFFNKNSNVKYISGSSLYSDTANQILSDIGTMYSNLQLKQYQDIGFKDNVVTPNVNDIIFSADGETATIRNGNFNVGDIICLEPSTYYPEGKYAKISAINGDKISYTEPTLEEIADHVTIYGSYQPEIIGVVPLMEGIEVETIDGIEARPQAYEAAEEEGGIIFLKRTDLDQEIIPTANTYSLGDIELKINATAQSNAASVSVTGGVKVKNIKATVDLDVWGIIVKSAEISVTDTIEASISVSGQLEKTFNLAKVPCRLWGVVGVDFVLAVKIGLEGSVSFIWSVDTSQSLEYKPLRAPKFHASGSNSNLDVELKAKAYIKPEFKAEFVIGPLSVASIGAYSGVEASAKTKIVGTSSDVGCIDVNAFVPLTIFVGAESKKGDDSLLGKLGVKKSWAIWTASTSPLKKKWHIEDGVVVPECTRDKKNQDETANEDDLATEEYEIDTEFINQIADVDKFLVLSGYYVVLDEGKEDVLKVSQLPEGYSVSDVMYESSDGSVATVQSGGRIKAIGSGSCIIKVHTNDGQYEGFCAVTVLASYDVDFTPLTV